MASSHSIRRQQRRRSALHYAARDAGRDTTNGTTSPANARMSRGDFTGSMWNPSHVTSVTHNAIASATSVDDPTDSKRWSLITASSHSRRIAQLMRRACER